MRHSWTPYILSTMFGLAFGWAVSAVSSPDDKAFDLHAVSTTSGLPEARLPSTAVAQTAGEAGSAHVELMDLVTASGRRDDAGIAALHRLQSRMRNDATFRAALLRHYGTTNDTAALEAIEAALAGLPPRMLDESVLELARGDAKQRASALRLLVRAPDASALAQAAVQALDIKHDADFLAQAVGALGSRTLFSPVLRQVALERLDVLALHADPVVRSESLRALAQLDQGARRVEPHLLDGLAAKDPQMRTDALHALAGSTLKSERLKTSLLRMAGDNAESTGARLLALHTLERFALSQDDYAVVQRVRPMLAAVTTDIDLSRSQHGSPPADIGGAIFSPFDPVQR